MIALIISGAMLLLQFALEAAKDSDFLKRLGLRSGPRRLGLHIAALGAALIALAYNGSEQNARAIADLMSRETTQKQLVDIRNEIREGRESSRAGKVQDDLLQKALARTTEIIARNKLFLKPTLNTNPHGVIDLGDVPINSRKTVQFSMENVGPGTLSLNATLSGSDAFKPMGPTHFDLMSDTPVTFGVVFAPVAEGEQRVQVTMRTADGQYDNPTVVGRGVTRR